MLKTGSSVKPIISVWVWVFYNALCGFPYLEGVGVKILIAYVLLRTPTHTLTDRGFDFFIIYLSIIQVERLRHNSSVEDVVVNGL